MFGYPDETLPLVFDILHTVCYGYLCLSTFMAGVTTLGVGTAIMKGPGEYIISLRGVLMMKG